MENTKKTKAIKSSFSMDNKNKYTVEASHQFNIGGKKAVVASVKDVLQVNTPTKQLISLQTSADYKQDKQIQVAGTLALYRLLKKPVNVKCG